MRHYPIHKRSYLLLLMLILLLSLSAFPGQSPVVQAASSSQLNPIQAENLLPGTTNWQLTNPTPEDDNNHTFDTGIEGYASAVSGKPGDTLNFSVSTTASSFTAEIYRLGYYQGTGGRLMRILGAMPGKTYPIPSPNPQTGRVEANWPAAFSITIPPNWTTGLYLVKLTDANQLQSYIPFTVKATRKADFVFIHSVNTDEAYNAWGGTSLYQDYTHTLSAGRAFEVSFDRPFFQNSGSGNMLVWEYPMLRFLEKNGYNLEYTTDVDVHTSSTTLQGHHGILIVGHAEYWSMAMRNHLQAAIDSGVNLGSFAANAIFWQIRYQASSTHVANRVIICYKDASLDPYNNVHNSLVTVNFRSAPVNIPEQTLLGSMYYSYFTENNGVGAPWVVKNASSWVFAGTGLYNGEGMPGLVGYEFDSFFPAAALPATMVGADGVNGVEVLAASPVTDIYNAADTANATLYTAPSGARVFNAGTIQWSWGLDWYRVVPTYPDLSNAAAQQITVNILHNFLTGLTTPGNVVKKKNFSARDVGGHGSCIPCREIF